MLYTTLTNLVLLTPLLTSTAYLQCARDETFFFTLFLHPSHLSRSSAILPSYLAQFSRPGMIIIATIFGIQLLAALWAISLSEETMWYWAGLVLTIGHFPFAPWAAPHLSKIGAMGREGKVDDKKVWEEMEGFLRAHRWRTWTMNLGAWMCFLVAVVKCMGS